MDGGLAGESLEVFAGEAHDAPLGLGGGADGFVDVDGGLVPGEHVPFEARAALLDGDAGEFGEQGFADALAAVLGGDVEVFQPNAVVAEPGGVAGEVESEAGGLAAKLCDEAGEAWLWAEAVAEEVGFGGYDGVGFALVEGQLADEAEDVGDVGGRGGTDRQHGGGRVGFRFGVVSFGFGV